ncbi:MAG: DUF2877 domain-containing protein, partial [bacterium]|nr:DUF2877 domain-containing protein [bacterium]
NPSLPERPTISDMSILTIENALYFGQGACRSYLGLPGGGILDEAVVKYTRALEGDLSLAYKLIGLGRGYTPAGDDVLTGFCATGARLGWLDMNWHQKLVVETSKTSTSLSATSLFFAGAGQVQGYLDRVFTAMDNQVALEDACLTLIREAGTTSGSDLLLGLVSASQFDMRQRGVTAYDF